MPVLFAVADHEVSDVTTRRMGDPLCAGSDACHADRLNSFSSEAASVAAARVAAAWVYESVETALCGLLTFFLPALAG
jgi:hypothetical protein